MPVEMPLRETGPYLTPEEVVRRWRRRIGLRALQNWRNAKGRRGPGWMRVGGRILYPLHLVQEYEKQHTIIPAK
jgi:hypothetical protein